MMDVIHDSRDAAAVKLMDALLEDRAATAVDFETSGIGVIVTIRSGKRVLSKGQAVHERDAFMNAYDALPESVLEWAGRVRDA